MISKKVDIFLKTLAEHISKDTDVHRKPKRLRKGFQHAVSSLKDGKLKEKLLNNLDDCFVELLKILEQQHANEQKENRNGTDTEQKETNAGIAEVRSNHNIGKLPTFVYNLYHKRDLGINYETLSQLEKSTQNIVYRTYMRCVLPHLDSKNLSDIAAKCQTAEDDDVFSWAGQIMELCACLHGDTNTASLRTVMKIFNKKYAEAAENANKTKRILKLLSYGEQFLKMFHFHNQTIKQEFEGRPKYEDFVAGILATHVDCHLQLFHCDASLCPLTGKQLCSFVLSLFGKQRHYGYDVLLQLEKVQSGDGSLILPLARHLLDNVKPRNSCRLYTKFVLAARFVTHWMPNDDTADIKQKACDVPAPGEFLDWIRDLDPDLLDQFPETKHFQGTQITKYLLHEAEEDLIQELFDLLIESYNAESRTENKPESETLEETDAVDNADLFVIDKAPDSVTLNTVKELLLVQEQESASNTLRDQEFEVNEEEEVVLDSDEKETEGNVQYEIITMEEALKMNLIERTEMALERIFDMENKEGNETVDNIEGQEQTVADGILKTNDQQEFDHTLDGVMIEIVDKDVEMGLVPVESGKQNPDHSTSVESSDDVVIIEESNSEECSIIIDRKATNEQVQLVQQRGKDDDVKSRNLSSKQMKAIDNNDAFPSSAKKRNSVERLGSPQQNVTECDNTSEMSSKHGSPSKGISLVTDDNLSVTEVSSPQIQSNVNGVDGEEGQKEYLNASPQCSPTVRACSADDHGGDRNNSFTKSSRRKSLGGMKPTASESVIMVGKSSPRKRLANTSPNQQEPVTEMTSTSEELDTGENSPAKRKIRNKTQITSQVTHCDLEVSVVNTSTDLKKDDQHQLKDDKPVTRRLKELKDDIDIASKHKRILSAAEMVKSLKAAKHEELTVFPKTYSGRRHSISVSKQDRCDNSSNPGARTQRKAATKAMEMLAVLSPRKRRDSLSSFRSSEDDVASTKTRKLTEERTKTRATDVSVSVKKLKSESTIKTRRSSMPSKQLAKTLDGSNSPSKPTPSKKVAAKVTTPKRRYSLRTLEKATKVTN